VRRSQQSHPCCCSQWYDHKHCWDRLAYAISIVDRNGNGSRRVLRKKYDELFAQLRAKESFTPKEKIQLFDALHDVLRRQLSYIRKERKMPDVEYEQLWELVAVGTQGPEIFNVWNHCLKA
jgi:hypothetical protein